MYILPVFFCFQKRLNIIHLILWRLKCFCHELVCEYLPMIHRGWKLGSCSVRHKPSKPDSRTQLSNIQQPPSVHVMWGRQPHVKGHHGGRSRVSIRVGIKIIATGNRNLLLTFLRISWSDTYRAFLQLDSCLNCLSLSSTVTWPGWITRLTS